MKIIKKIVVLFAVIILGFLIWFIYSRTMEKDSALSLCGGIAGVLCPEGYECRHKGNYPDAQGVCIKIK